MTILNKFIVDAQPIEELILEYYTTTLHPSISMFVKRVGKVIQTQNCEEAKNVEKKNLSLGRSPRVEENRAASKKPLLLIKPIDQKPTDLDSVLKLVNKLSNEVVDLKRNVSKGSSHRKPFRDFYRKTNNQPKPPKYSNPNMNLDEFFIGNLCSYHQTNCSNKTFP
jgi:hypothetical protein